MMDRAHVATMLLQGMVSGKTMDHVNLNKHMLIHRAISCADDLIAELQRTTPQPNPKELK